MSTTRARFFFFGGTALFLGPMEQAEEHRHHAAQVVLGLDGPFDIRRDSRTYTGRTAVIAPDLPHRFFGCGGRQAHFIFDPEHAQSVTMASNLCGDHGVALVDSTLLESEIEALRSSLSVPADCRLAAALCDAVIAALLGDREAVPDEDPRIRRAKLFMRRLPENKTSVDAIAAEVGLSEGRLIHLFKDETGVPIRRYLLWLRLIGAVERVLDGMSLTSAAHEAGFSDSAHLSRTFKGMFGVTPSFLFKNSRFIQVISCVD